MQCHIGLKSLFPGSIISSLFAKSAAGPKKFEVEEAVTFFDFDIR